MSTQPTINVPEAGKATFEALRERGALTAAELGVIVGRHEGNVRKYLGELRAAGLVQRNPDHTYSLTPAAGGADWTPRHTRSSGTKTSVWFRNEELAALDAAAKAAGISRAEVVRLAVSAALGNDEHLEGRLAS